MHTLPTSQTIYPTVRGADAKSPIQWYLEETGLDQPPDVTYGRVKQILLAFIAEEVNPVVRQPEVIAAYGFPAVYVKIQSEASWIR